MGSECQPQRDRLPAVFVPRRAGVGRLCRSTPGRWAPGRPPHHGRGRTPSRPGRERTGQNGPRRATTAPGAGNAPNPARTACRGPPRSARPRPYLPGTHAPQKTPPHGKSTKSHIFLIAGLSTKCADFVGAGAGRAGGPIERVTPVFGACRLPVGRLGPLMRS